ncbi:MAG: hypothetical protein QNJ45_11665 [Ardenticatenaceae bacterium]|nr:hypothetical protein [Ardenticatenaceae bacterium]
MTKKVAAIIVMLSCLIFVIHLSLSRSSALNVSAAATQKGMWVWNANTVTSSIAKNELLTYAQIKNIQSVYIYSFALLPTQSNALKQFVEDAHAKNVHVELLRSSLGLKSKSSDRA